VRQIAAAKARLDATPAPPAGPTEEVVLLREIRDSLRR
jgi:large-conductance mechanosensitive channel